MLPFGPYEYEIPKKKKNEKVIFKVMMDSLKKSNEIVNFVTQSVPHIDYAIKIADLA
jgi:hypothetical protein